MTWIVIGLVLVIAFGPILWLVPSKRDKRLTKLRARARQEGLMVEIRNLPKPNPEAFERVSSGGVARHPVIQLAVYGLLLGRKLRFLPGWRLVRQVADRPDPFPDWSFDERPAGGEGRRYLDEMLSLVGPFLERLPEDVIAVQITPRSVHVYWLEKPATTEDLVTSVAAEMRSLAAALQAFEAGIQQQLDDTDS